MISPNAPFRSNMGPTWGQLRPNLDQLAPTSAQLGSKMAQLGPSSTHVGAISPAQSEILKTPVVTGIFCVFCYRWCFVWSNVPICSPCCVCVGPNLVRSCRQNEPSCGMLELSCVSVCIWWLQFGSLWAQLQPNMTYWRQLGWVQDSATWAQLGGSPKFRSQTCDNMDRWKAEMVRVREEKRREEREDQIRKSQWKKIQVREQVGKSKALCFSNDLWLRRVENQAR